MENNDMIGAVEEYVLQNTKKRMNAGELKAERIEEHDMLNWVKANRGTGGLALEHKPNCGHLFF